MHQARHRAFFLGLLLLLTHAGANCREVMREEMGETAACRPGLREGNVCIQRLFADARREAPGDGTRELVHCIVLTSSRCSIEALIFSVPFPFDEIG
jgi:hypothetical protein